MSPVGLWPLLALLVEPATPQVKADLVQALGMEDTHATSNDVLDLLHTKDGSHQPLPSGCRKTMTLRRSGATTSTTYMSSGRDEIATWTAD